MPLQISGVALKMAYSDVESLSDQLFSTGLHRHHGKEFALALHLRSFPHNVLSVHLYCAHLESQ